MLFFDFDGLLVDTEQIHYQAYQEMCRNRGFDLPLDFIHYCAIAHYTSEGLADIVYQSCPILQKEEPRWEVLYREKTAIYHDKLRNKSVVLMPGVEEFLQEIVGIPSCVVTHSARPLTETIRKKQPLLNCIPFWVTREDYEDPKPASDAYLLAIRRFVAPDEEIIGFEDTPRGIRALQGTRAKPVLVTQIDYPEIPLLQEQGVLYFRDFHEVKKWGGRNLPTKN